MMFRKDFLLNTALNTKKILLISSSPIAVSYYSKHISVPVQ